MPNCDHVWRSYEELQQRATKLQHLNDCSWGIESALNLLLKAIGTNTIPSEPVFLDEAISRAVASGARLQRSRLGALKTWMRSPESISTSGLAEATIELERIGRTVKDRDQDILMDAAFGYTDREIARKHASTPGAIRVRLSRLRLKLATNGGALAGRSGSQAAA